MPRTAATDRDPAARDQARMVAMMGLFFLVVCAVGILRPIRNTLALDGLGDTDFYKVYLVSAAVIAFVPAYNHVSDRVPRRWLTPAVALFFASNLVVFRLLYREGSTAFGLTFYGWYDLFAAALVTQFFMATQLFFDVRLARRAYPLVIAGGSIGAALGGAITGFFADALGTPNLMLVAAGLIVAFSVGIPLVWRDGPERERRKPRATLRRGDFRDLVKDPQVRLIAGLVLITILVKQLVDYEFNTLTKAVFVERDAMAQFQGRFNAATQWLPIVVLGFLQPALTRFGIGLAVLLLPVTMLASTAGLAVFFGLGAAVVAKAAETSLRYSAERAGREILYVPVPDDIKLKAKTYIDVALEKGVGKVLSAGLIFALLAVMDYRWITLVAVALAIVWVLLARAARREYTVALGRAIEGRFAGLTGTFASLADATTAPVLAASLAAGGRRAAFALDLLRTARPDRLGSLADPLHALLAHESATVRARALDTLAGYPDELDREAASRRLRDGDPGVREAAVRALAATGDEGDIVHELLSSDHTEVRTAVLACVVREDLGPEALAAARTRYRKPWESDAEAGAEQRIEAALATAAMHGAERAVPLLSRLAADPDVRVARAALGGAGMLGDAALDALLVRALGNRATREAATAALARQGVRIVTPLAERLLDPAENRAVRHSIPMVLARIPRIESVRALIDCVKAPETGQILDYRSLKALGKVRAARPDLEFEETGARALVEREIAEAQRLAQALAVVQPRRSPEEALLARALREAWAERREGAFRALGLLHPPDDVYRCYLAIVRGERVPRANALEWLETALGHRPFARLAPVARQEPELPQRGPADVLSRLAEGEDAWIARIAARVAAGTGEKRMDVVDRVLLLEQVDLLRDARSAHLALVASIAEDIAEPDGAVLLREGEPAAALFIVIEGTVLLESAVGTMKAERGAAIGAWSLIDDAPAIAGARAEGPVRVLRIGREDFYDLLTDYPEFAIGLMQGLARRMRELVA